mmetsp:Transcript_18417/g.55087  ORF Transcript_18417/g.55087 Transcript_18417/m.55087 type:complete len:220 (-) Transcript_18417:329-988(-)
MPPAPTAQERHLALHCHMRPGESLALFSLLSSSLVVHNRQRDASTPIAWPANKHDMPFPSKLQTTHQGAQAHTSRCRGRTPNNARAPSYTSSRSGPPPRPHRTGSIPCDVGEGGEVALEALRNLDAHRIYRRPRARDREASGRLEPVRIKGDEVDCASRHLEEWPNLLQHFLDPLLCQHRPLWLHLHHLADVGDLLEQTTLETHLHCHRARRARAARTL